MSQGDVPGSALGLVVPVFNEAERLGDYAKDLLAYVDRLPPGSELVFVDDGSTDRTAEIVDDLLTRASRTARVLRRPHEGKGAAVVAGLRTITAPYAGFCDLDLSTPLDQFDLVAAAARRAPVLAIGSRDLAASTLLRSESSVRETLGRLYNRLLQVTVTPGVVDTQCGAKVAATLVWHEILPWCREVGFAWDAEVVAVALALGIEVAEVAIEWRHDDRSRVRLTRDGAAMVRATPRIARRARAASAARRARVEARQRDGVFDDVNARDLAASDRNHWWFRSKAAFVATALRRTSAGAPHDGWLVDAGGGAGGVTALLGWHTHRVLVVEGNADLARQAHAVHGLHAARAEVAHVPLASGRATVVCLLDVIEHLHDPGAALREAVRLLRPDGRLVVNVPAHQWLWSPADEQLGHVRRYTRPALLSELAAAGFEPVLTTHVFSWLLAPVWLKRRVVSRSTAELGLDQTSPLVDRAAMVLTAVERTALGRLALPFGTSLLCVAVPRR